jgi:flagellar hook-associated protein 2
MTDSLLNTSFANTTDSGNLQFSGLSSNIDWQSTVDAIMAAKRIPATQVEDKIAVNDTKLTAYSDLSLIADNLKTSLDQLRGGVSFFAEDVFDTKQAFTTSSAAATAPGGYTPVAPDSLVGVLAGDDAAVGSHRLTVHQLAQAHQIRSDSFTDTNATTLASQGFAVGSFTLNGESITVDGDDTLGDLQDKINASNAGVNASVVSVSPTEHYLVMAAEDTGTVAALNFAGGNATTDSLGFTDGVGGIKTELTAAQNSIIDVDGITGITRSTNTVDDVLEGITLDLFGAEPDTEINIEIEQDLTQIQSSVQGFVDAYNLMKEFILDQKTQRVRSDDPDAESEFGSLAFDSTLRNIDRELGEMINTVIPGADSGYATLGQIGIEIGSNFMLEIKQDKFNDALVNNTDGVRKVFAFDATTSDSRVSVVGFNQNAQPNVDGSGNLQPYYLDISGTDASGNVIQASISETAGGGVIGDGSATQSSQVITATDNTAANGLQLFFNGDPSLGPIDDIEVTFTRGVADQLFGYLEKLTALDGQLTSDVNSIEQQNVDYQERVTQIDTRLEVQRNSLTQQFISMETALSQLNQLRDQLTEQLGALNGNS